MADFYTINTLGLVSEFTETPEPSLFRVGTFMFVPRTRHESPWWGISRVIESPWTPRSKKLQAWANIPVAQVPNEFRTIALLLT